MASPSRCEMWIAFIHRSKKNDLLTRLCHFHAMSKPVLCLECTTLQRGSRVYPQRLHRIILQCQSWRDTRLTLIWQVSIGVPYIAYCICVLFWIISIPQTKSQHPDDPLLLTSTMPTKEKDQKHTIMVKPDSFTLRQTRAGAEVYWTGTWFQCCQLQRKHVAHVLRYLWPVPLQHQ